jgi:hypothetical protein
VARSSWLDDERTERRYAFPDGVTWIVINEYQPVPCPDCGAEQHQRLTHIFHIDANGNCVPEYHINRGESLGELRSLLIAYRASDNEPVHEVERDGAWLLIAGGAIIARELQ